MSADPPPVSIAPPTAIRLGGWLLVAEALGILVLAAVVITGGHDADLKWSLATAGYFVVLAALMAAVGRGLLQGRRWSRTPAVVINLIVALVGFYLAVPSAQLLAGLAVIAVGAGTLILLLGKQSNDWIKSFPSLFGPAPDH